MQHNFTLNGMQYLAIIIVTLHAVRGANFRGSQHLALETTPNLMNKPARNLPLMGPDGPDEFDPETLPKWMKPTVGDDSDQGGNVANRESPNRYRKHTGETTNIVTPYVAPHAHPSPKARIPLQHLQAIQSSTDTLSH